MDFLEHEIEHAEALLKLPSEKEGSLRDSVSEWENNGSELSDLMTYTKRSKEITYMLFVVAYQC